MEHKGSFTVGAFVERKFRGMNDLGRLRLTVTVLHL